MRWPWAAQPEQRASYTDRVTEALVAAAAGTATPAPSAQGIAEAMWAAAFAAAEVSGRDSDEVAALLAHLGARAAVDGDAVALIRVDGASLILEPAEVTAWAGGWRSLRADITIPGPDAELDVRNVAEARLVRLVVFPDPHHAWRGRSLRNRAGDAWRALGELERSIADEAATPRGQAVSTPSGEGDTPEAVTTSVAARLAPFKDARGRIVGIPTPRLPLGTGNSDASPRQDLGIKRFGPEFGAEHGDLYRTLEGVVLAAAGIPPTVTDGSATPAGLREAHRAFLSQAIRPAIASLQRELRAKLDDPTLRITLPALREADLVARSRAAKNLADLEGVDVERALALAGIDV